MLHVFICEDDPIQRNQVETMVNKCILEDDVYIDIALSTNTPASLLDYLEEHKTQSGLYFLDVDLQSDINGIELGTKIRKIDPSATIVFVTTHSEMTHLVFTHKVEAMDYIIKGIPPEELETRVADCMHLAYQRFLDGKHSQNKYFSMKVGGQVMNVLCDDILFFESCTQRRNRVLLHMANGTLEFYGTLNDTSNLGSQFFRCHQSYVINVDRIKHVDMQSRDVEMINGTVIPVARQKKSEFLSMFMQHAG